MGYTEQARNLVKYDLKELKQVILAQLGGLYDYVLGACLCGSLSEEADMDVGVIIKENSPKIVKEEIYANPTPQVRGVLPQTLDFGLMLESEFEDLLGKLDISTTQWVLQSKPILNKQYFEKKKEQVLNTKPNSSHAKHAGFKSLIIYDMAKHFLNLEEHNQRLLIAKNSLVPLPKFKSIILNDTSLNINYQPTETLDSANSNLSYALSYLTCNYAYKNQFTNVPLTLNQLLQIKTPFQQLTNTLREENRQTKRGRKLTLEHVKRNLKLVSKTLEEYL